MVVGINAPVARRIKLINLAFTAGYEDTTSLATTHTDAGKSIGAAAPDRRLLVCVSGVRTTAAAISITSVKVTGSGTAVTGTVVTDGTTTATQVQGSSNRAIEAIYIVDAGTGSQLEGDTTGDIEIVFNGATYLYSVSVYSMTGQGTTTATQVQKTTGTNPLTRDQNCNAGGAILAAVTNNAAATVTYAGVDEDRDVGAVGAGSGSKMFAAAQSNLTVSATLTSAGEQGMVVASFGP